MVILETNGVTHNVKKIYQATPRRTMADRLFVPPPLGKIDGASPPSQNDCCAVPGYNTVSVGLCNFF